MEDARPPSPRPLPRTRAVGAGQLRTLLVVARQLNFRAAADELALTQSAVSRQIQALEDEVGVPLFVRGPRAVALTAAGQRLVQAVGPALAQVDTAVQALRQQQQRRSVVIDTWASLATLWLIPRLDDFQRLHPDIDLQIDSRDSYSALDQDGLDVVLRCCTAEMAPQGAVWLFDEGKTLVAAPSLLARSPALRTPADLAAHTLIDEAAPQPRLHTRWMSFSRWLRLNAPPGFQPRRWLRMPYEAQNIQATLSGQGLALGRLALVADLLARGELVEPLPQTRMASPLSCWLIVTVGGAVRPEVQDFCAWLQDQARATRQSLGLPSSPGNPG